MLKQQTLEQVKLVDLAEEIKTIRSIMIGWLGRDPEGEYNPDFVKKTLDAAKDESVYTFKNKKEFLNLLNS